MSTIEYELSRIEMQSIVLKVHINCQGCMHKVKKGLRKIEGVYKVDINAEEQKVIVIGIVNASTLVHKLAKLGKHAEILSTSYNQDHTNLDDKEYTINDFNASGNEYMIPTFYGKDHWGRPQWYFNQDLGAQTMESEINQQLTAPTPLFFTNFSDRNNQNFSMNNENPEWQESMMPMMRPENFQENNGTNYFGFGIQEWEHNLPQESSINEYNHQPFLMTNRHGYYCDYQPSEAMHVSCYNHAPLGISINMQETPDMMVNGECTHVSAHCKPKMKTQSTIGAFFKRKSVEIESSNELSNTPVESDHGNNKDHPTKSLRVEVKEGFDLNSLELDPGLRPNIWQYPIEKRDEVQRAYTKAGLYQCMLSTYPKSAENSRSFQPSWFKLFPSWLEYSPSVDDAFCLS